MGQRLDSIKGFVVLALILVYLLFGRGYHNDPRETATKPIVTPAQAMPSVSPAPIRQPLGGPGYSGYEAPTTPAVAATALAANSMPTPGPNAVQERQQVTWRHITTTGVRWSLRPVSTISMLLLVDLGGEKVANVSVAPEFEKLDIAGINDRVDHVHSVIIQGFPLRTGNFIFDRNGSLRQIP